MRAPATTANLGAGFDSLGLALQLYNRVTIEEGASGIEVSVSGEGTGVLETESPNLVVLAMQHLFSTLGRPLPSLRLRQENAIPLARGLGSSSAAIVAGLAGANCLAGSPFSLPDLVSIAAALDGHPDNAAACLLGGLAVTAMDAGQVHYARISPLPGLKAVLFIPNFETSTRTARGALPSSYSREDAVFTSSRAALTAAAFATGRWELLRVGMQDRLHQRFRAEAYPEMPRLIEAALEAGARGAALSGSGPTIIALTDQEPEPVAAGLEQAADALGVAGRTLCVGFDAHGAQVTQDE